MIKAIPNQITITPGDCYQAKVHYAGLYIGEADLHESGEVVGCDLLDSYLNESDDPDNVRAIIGMKLAVM